MSSYQAMPHYLVRRDPRQLRRDITGVVLCVSGFIVVLNTVASLVLVGVLLVTAAPELQQLFSSEMAGAASAASVAGLMDSALYREINDLIFDVTTQYMGLASLIGMLCGLPLFFIIRGRLFVTKDITRRHSKVSVSTLLVMFCAIMGVQFVMVMIQLVFSLLLGEGMGSGGGALEDTMAGLALSPWGVLYVVFLGPICEELVFRGAVMRKLERYGANFAIVVSSLLFALYHLIFFQAVFAFFVGIILAYVAGRFSLKWACLLHMLNNGIALLPYYIPTSYANVPLDLLCYFACFVVAVIVLATKRRLIAAQLRAGAPSEPKVFARAFSSPLLIIYIVLCGTVAIALPGLL